MPLWFSQTSGLRSAQIDVQVHDPVVEPFVLRMQAGVVEHLEHKMIRNQDVRDQVLNSLIAGNLCEPPKQNGSYSAQVIVHDPASGHCRTAWVFRV
jgi:hypothetical protein